MTPQLFPPSSRLDEATKAAGRRGVALARAALAAHRPADLESMRRFDRARRSLATATTTLPTQGAPR